MEGMGSQTATQYRLWYCQERDAFFILVIACTGSVEERKIRPHAIKTVLTEEMAATLHLASKLTDDRRLAAASKVLSPIQLREFAARRGIEVDADLNVLVVDANGKSHRFRNPPICDGFKSNEPMRLILGHPGVLTWLHESVRGMGFGLEQRRYFRVSDHPTDPLIKPDQMLAVPCPYCGAQPLSTDFPIPEKAK
jgi:hypothetical protein